MFSKNLLENNNSGLYSLLLKLFINSNSKSFKTITSLKKDFTIFLTETKSNFSCSLKTGTKFVNILYS